MSIQAFHWYDILLSCTNKNSSRSQRLPLTELYLVCSMHDNVIFVVSFRNELVPLYSARRHRSATRTGSYLPFLGEGMVKSHFAYLECQGEGQLSHISFCSFYRYQRGGSSISHRKELHAPRRDTNRCLKTFLENPMKLKKICLVWGVSCFTALEKWSVRQRH